MSKGFYWSEDDLKAYRERIARDARKRPSTPSVEKMTDDKGQVLPIRCGKRKAPNLTEKRFNDEMLRGLGIYEGVTFNAPGGKYTPDWVYFDAEGRMECYEVKGSHRFASQGRSAYAFKDCCDRYPSVSFYWAKLGMTGEWIVVDGRTGECIS